MVVRDDDGGCAFQSYDQLSDNVVSFGIATVVPQNKPIYQMRVCFSVFTVSSCVRPVLAEERVGAL